MLDNLQLLFVYAPVMNVQMLLDGIFIGAVFALAAYGLALVWGVMNVKNLLKVTLLLWADTWHFHCTTWVLAPSLRCQLLRW